MTVDQVREQAWRYLKEMYEADLKELPSSGRYSMAMIALLDELRNAGIAAKFYPDQSMRVLGVSRHQGYQSQTNDRMAWARYSTEKKIYELTLTLSAHAGRRVRREAELNAVSSEVRSWLEGREGNATQQVDAPVPATDANPVDPTPPAPAQ